MRYVQHTKPRTQSRPPIQPDFPADLLLLTLRPKNIPRDERQPETVNLYTK